jgi:hypothetical protein
MTLKCSVLTKVQTNISPSKPCAAKYVCKLALRADERDVDHHIRNTLTDEMMHCFDVFAAVMVDGCNTLFFLKG